MKPNHAKTKSEAFLRDHGIQVNPNLPTIEAMDELSPQCAKSVATRAVVLSYMIGLGCGQSGEQMKRPLLDFHLFDATSENEKRLLEAPDISDQEKIDCTWLTEGAQSLCFCLALVDLDPFRHCDDDLASHFPEYSSDPWEFINTAKLRPFVNIYEQADLHYRLHWATRNARLTGQACQVEESVVTERRRALDWVIGVESDWDEIPMDT